MAEHQDDLPLGGAIQTIKMNLSASQCIRITEETY